MTAIKDRTFQRYGKLVAIAECGRRRKRVRWLCICDCGDYIVVDGSCLGSTTNSCGCPRRNAPAKLDISSGRHLCCKCKLRPISEYHDKTRPNSSICSKCRNDIKKVNRITKWNAGVRPTCKNHPFTIVNGSAWRSGNRKLCSVCLYNSKKDKLNELSKRRHEKRKNDPEYKEIARLRAASHYKTLKLRNHGN